MGLPVNNMVMNTASVPQDIAQAGNQGPPEEDPRSDGGSIDTCVRPKKKIQSGMLALPTDNIKTPQVWPHFNLSFGFVTESIQFHQLSFKQYVAGETKTVLNASDSLEVRGSCHE